MTQGKRKRAENQDDKQVRVFTFKLDREKEKEGETRARAIIEEMEQMDGWTLRKQVVHWLTQNEQEIIVFQESSVSEEIQEAFAQFKADFFMEVLGVLRDTNPDMLRKFADNQEPEESGSKLDSEFVSGMLKGFKR